MTLDPKTVKRLDLDKDEVLLSGDEKPEEIIGFSIAFIEVAGQKYPRVIRMAQRIKAGKNNKDLAKNLRTVIKTLKNKRPILNSRDTDKNSDDESLPPVTVELEDNVLSFEDFSKIETALKNEKEMSANKTSPKDTVWVNIDGRAQRAFKKPLLEINKPTLLVFTINAPTKWGQIVMTGDYIKPRENHALDPNCSGLRLWMDDQVLGFYSNYTHGSACSEKMDEYWYDLIFSFVQKNKDGSGEILKSSENSYDPGNGNGSGQSFP